MDTVTIQDGNNSLVINKTNFSKAEITLSFNNETIKLSTLYHGGLFEASANDALRNLSQGEIRIFSIQMDDKEFAVQAISGGNSLFPLLDLTLNIYCSTIEKVSDPVVLTVIISALGDEYQDWGRTVQDQTAVFEATFKTDLNKLKQIAELFKQ